MRSSSRPQRWHIKPSERRFLLIIGDILTTCTSLLLALYLWAAGDAWMEFSLEFIRTRPPFWFFLLPILWLVLMIELYDLRRANNLIETLKGISIATVICAILYLLIYFTSEPNSLPRRGVAFFIIINALLILIWRILYIKIFTAPQFLRRVLIIGAGKAGHTLVNIIASQSPKPFNLIGLIDDDHQKIGTKIGDYEVLAGSEKLLQIIRENEISDLILAITGDMKSVMFQAILTAQELGINITTMSNTYEEILERVPIFLLEADWVIRSFVEKVHTGSVYRLSKRGLDLIGALIGVLIMAILLPFISLALLIDSGLPIFYRQERLGRGGEPYTIFKFRTMRQNAEKEGEVRLTSMNDARITRIGRFLRRTHLDELPQFINVLQGNMSLVGPRSERKELVTYYQQEIPFYRARLLVKPGITGWAQINFGYAETVEDTGIKLEYDLYYIEHRNIFVDTVIMVRTVGTVLGFKGR